MLRRIRFIGDQRVLLYDKGATRKDLLKIHRTSNPVDDDVIDRIEATNRERLIDEMVANGLYFEQGQRMMIMDTDGSYLSVSVDWGRRR